jgi:hypothetical protein
VIEPAAGADRATLAFLVDAYDEEDLDGETRTVLRLHPRLAPVKVAILPLLRKNGQPELAREIHQALRDQLQCEYDEGGSIGRRYRRQDEIGTPWCVTIDHESVEAGTVTVRDRDSLAQERLAIDELAASDNAVELTEGLDRRHSQTGGSRVAPGRRRRGIHQPLRGGAASPMAGSSGAGAGAASGAADGSASELTSGAAAGSPGDSASGSSCAPVSMLGSPWVLASTSGSAWVSVSV